MPALATRWIGISGRLISNNINNGYQIIPVGIVITDFWIELNGLPGGPYTFDLMQGGVGSILGPYVIDDPDTELSVNNLLQPVVGGSTLTWQIVTPGGVTNRIVRLAMKGFFQ